MSEIHFFSEDISFNFQEEEKAENWLSLIASHHRQDIGALNYIFCSDDYLYQLNVEYLQHDTLTDIITFPYEEKGETISGDIFVSIERVKENALKYGVDEKTELLRVMAHGLLHLCGYRDKTDSEKAEMRSAEDKALSLWKNQTND
jgi:probable rRNA maturation factor